MDMTEPHAPESVEVKPFMYNPWLLNVTPGVGALDHDDSSSSQAFGPDENSSYFQFFRGIYNDYQELSVKKQRLFKRNCLNLLHTLLDEEDALQSDADAAVNLSAHPSDDEREQKFCVTEKDVELSILPNTWLWYMWHWMNTSLISIFLSSYCE